VRNNRKRPIKLERYKAQPSLKEGGAQALLKTGAESQEKRGGLNGGQEGQISKKGELGLTDSF